MGLGSAIGAVLFLVPAGLSPGRGTRRPDLLPGRGNPDHPRDAGPRRNGCRQPQQRRVLRLRREGHGPGPREQPWAGSGGCNWWWSSPPRPSAPQPCCSRLAGDPVWALTLIFMVVFTAINLAGVKNFGEFESWFAILKVAAILLFLGIGTALLLGWLPDVESPAWPTSTPFRPGRPRRHRHRALCGGLRLRWHRNRGRGEPRRPRIRRQRGPADPQCGVDGSWSPTSVRCSHRRGAPPNVGGTHLALRRRLQHGRHLRAGAAITLAAVAALSALNANLYGASRMISSPSERGEAPRLLRRSPPHGRPCPPWLISAASDSSPPS